MSAGQVFMHEIHLVAPCRVSLGHQLGLFLWLGEPVCRSRVCRLQAQAAASHLRGLPLGRLRGTTTPLMSSSPPHTPHGSLRSSAPARHSLRTGQGRHSAFASSTSDGDSAKNSSGSFVRQGSSRAALSSLAMSASRTLIVICVTSL